MPPRKHAQAFFLLCPHETLLWSRDSGLRPIKHRPLNILYASFDPVQAPKGASTHIGHFVRALAASVGEVTLLTLPPAPGFGLLEAERVQHRVVDAAEANFLDRAMAFRRAVADELRARPYDVAHVRSIWEGAPAACAAHRGDVRVVYEVNGLPSIELRVHYPALRQRSGLIAKLREQETLIARDAALVVTPSQVTADHLAGMGVDPACIEVIPNGVDVELFKPAARPANDPPRLLYVGTLAPWQGADTLFVAVKKLLRTHAVELTMLGSGRRSWVKRYQKLARRMHIDHAVEFVPSLPHELVPAAIAEADICVAPLTRTERNTRQGCCPIKILEYMACGKPVVASRLAVVRELIDDEATGLLFKPNNPNHLCHKLAALLESAELRERLGAQARQAVVERFTWSLACERLAAAYDRVSG